MSHPRDPRLRRQGAQTDPLAAAVRLEMAADAMRGAQLQRGPDERIAAAVQLGTVDPPLTADEFAAALGGDEDHVADPEQYRRMLSWADTVQSLADDGRLDELPAPPLPPAASAPHLTHTIAEDAPPALAEVFSSEHRRTLDWRPRHDEESRRYGIRERLRGSAPVQDVLLPSGWPTLDQGTEGSCVGMALTAAWNTTHPDEHPRDEQDALELFHLAERLDEHPGEGLGGSSVLGGCKAAVQLGLFGGYLWSFGTRDIAQAILTGRAVVVGVPWLPGMYETGPGGLVQLAGDDEGLGHALAVVGIRRRGPQGQDGPFFVWHNSWGDDYGDGGLGYVHHRDLAQLLRGRGEAAIPTDGPQAPA